MESLFIQLSDEAYISVPKNWHLRLIFSDFKTMGLLTPGLRQTANKCMRGHTLTHRPEGVYMLHSLAWEGYIVLWFP